MAADMLLSSTASAGMFGVRVVDDSGAPVVGASVCVGLPGNYKQFGALFTDSDGQATTSSNYHPPVTSVDETGYRS